MSRIKLKNFDAKIFTMPAWEWIKPRAGYNKMSSRKILSGLCLGLALTAAAGDCLAGWSPFKLQVSQEGWVWPEDIDTVAGLNLNISGDTPEMYGLQMGFQNGGNTAAGAQLGLVYNYALDSFYGLQLSPARNLTEMQYGIQFGGWNVSSEMFGAQVGWLRNQAGSGLGLMLAPVNVSTARMRGIQIGVVNNSPGDMSGIQLGAVNICRGTLKGLQIGFANLAGRNGVLPVTIGLNAGF
ncbi:MAG: hypothetical protein WCW52_11855 [Elusimicrobiales bacterium]|jgi:hypothetical protein